jgi:Zn-dependent protease with chaperone function
MGSRAAEFESALVYSPEQVLLPEISYTSFSYPGDQEALAALKNVPGAPTVLAYLQENFTEQMILVQNNEQMLRAGPRSYASIYKLLCRCSDILSLAVPDLYISQNPVMNAYTAGHRNPCIVLQSGLIEGLTADELTFVIGHELGHIKCGHGLYRQLGDLLLKFWDAAAAQIPIPGVGLIRMPLLIAYWEWYRRAEHTCDRAGLLCLQHLDPSSRALGKLAGKVAGFEDEVDIESAIAQSHVRKDVNKLVLVISILEILANTHPFVPARIRELKAYFESDDYKRILSGTYEKDHLHLHEGGHRVTCPVCKTKLNSTLKFCNNCGANVASDAAPSGKSGAEAQCEQCQRSIAPGSKFCPLCGAMQKDVILPPPPSGLDKVKASFRFGKNP